MTTMKQSPTAAEAGSSATASFRAGNATGFGEAQTSTERVDTVVRAVLDAVHGVIRAHQVTYPEFQAAKRWLMDLGEGREWPLFLDVFVEHAVEEVAARSQQGTPGTILGPYYLPGQTRLPAVAALPARPDEPGSTWVLSGQVRDIDGNPVGGAELDVWQNSADGFYSGFAPHLPEGNLRGVVVTEGDGRFEITTILPVPYQVPTDGPTGELIAAAGWHPWRPAHLHLLVRAPGHRTITTQLYFSGGRYVDDDVAHATKAELILNPETLPDGTHRSDYDFVLERD
ncbi:dioxygenase [Pseudonocardia sp.]|uniref:dioxygenase family protein n=1 Tax=Pseudonocardia sp. TaxID=60912 RepID=UPI003D14B4EB